jgi:adenosylhomocysteine nucleosidase
MAYKRIGILGAMPEEINGVVALLNDKKEVVRGMRTYYVGTINDIDVVVVFSRWGKVASATTVTHLIVEFAITQLIFTGVAGGINPNIAIGDVVVADSLVQHDLDARPIMERFEIPLLGKKMLSPPHELVKSAFQCVNGLVSSGDLIDLLSLKEQQQFFLRIPKVVIGQIASGDQFFSNDTDKDNLLKMLPDVLCVEMEGAAVAQVCFEYGIPYVIIRIISDDANENSVVDFNEFVTQVASRFGVAILREMIN